MNSITQDKQERKNAPLVRGALDYFPAALMGVAECSRIANEQHNPGQEMHWARNKSNDHADCIMRHLIERDKVDGDGIPHVAKVAWRALALAQEYYEAQGYAPGLASRWDEGPSPRETFIEETTKTEASNEEPKFKLHDRWYNDVFGCEGAVVEIREGEAYIQWERLPSRLPYRQCENNSHLTLVRRG